MLTLKLGSLFILREFNLVVEETLVLAAGPTWGEDWVSCVWNLHVIATIKQIAVYWKLVLKLIQLLINQFIIIGG